MGNGEKLFFFLLVIRVFGGWWVNAMSLKNYFRGSWLRCLFPMLGFLHDSLQAPGV